jgi:uncharacterized protein YecE (DUF72 family)
MTERGKLFVGTSGFAYKEWKGSFYPEDLSDKKMLEHYSQNLPSVEINYTFRRLPSESTITNWKEQSAPGFQITLKASQRITHTKRLKECQEEVDEFLRRAKPLDDRLGVILFQTPPNLKFEPERLETFLSGLPPVFRYAFEFRNETFFTEEPKALLAKHGVALVGAETEEKALAEIPVTANSYAYLRLRKEDYPEDELDGWAKRIGEVLEQGTDVYCYFKHEGGGVGPMYAQRVKDAL